MNYSQFFFTLFISIFVISCKKEPVTIEKWDQVIIDPKIGQNKTYKELNNHKEIYSFIDSYDSLNKRSSDVSYFIIDKTNLEGNKFFKKNSKQNKCKAFFFNKNSDTLSINIGLSNGFTGRGFTIKLINNKFYTEGYYSSDVIIEGKIEPTHKIIYQNLTLDKTNYKIGDSLFGKIEFESLVTDSENHQTQHFGKGYFRTKIKKI